MFARERGTLRLRSMLRTNARCLCLSFSSARSGTRWEACHQAAHGPFRLQQLKLELAAEVERGTAEAEVLTSKAEQQMIVAASAGSAGKLYRIAKPRPLALPMQHQKQQCISEATPASTHGGQGADGPLAGNQRWR